MALSTCPACFDQVVSEDLVTHLLGFHGWSEARVLAEALPRPAQLAAHLRAAADRLDKIADWPDGLRAQATYLEDLIGQLRQRAELLAAGEPARPV